GLDARVGEPGELTLRGLDRGEPEDVARSDTEHLTPLEPPQPHSALVGARAPRQGAKRLLHQLVTRLLAGERIVVAERLDEVWLPPEGVAEQTARAEQPAGALGGLWRFPERAGERRRTGFALGEASQLEQAEVGVRRPRQPAQDHRQQLLHDTR